MSDKTANREPVGSRDHRRARRWRRVGIALAALALVVVGALVVDRLRFHWALDAAKAEIARGAMKPALERLEPLAPRFSGRGHGEYDYYLGMARWAAGRRGDALGAFARVPAGTEFAHRAGFFQVEDAVIGGRLREAEDRLLELIAEAPESTIANEWLERVYRIQARFDDVKPLLQARLALAEEPIPVLRALWRLERGTVSLESLREGLDQCARQAPRDDRVWLGRARVALLAGQLDEAKAWLESCSKGRRDAAVERAWLDWAAASERPDEVLRALERIGPTALRRVEQLRWRAWLARRSVDDSDERAALQAWLALEPGQSAVLERLSELAVATGDTQEATRWREAKSALDQALLAYDRSMRATTAPATGPERLELVRLAEATGRPLDAIVWLRLLDEVNPREPGTESLRARLGTLDQALATLSSPADPALPWPRVEPRVARSSSETPALVTPARFRDDAKSAGLDFTFNNGQTPLHQMPEPLSGGVALLDYDGDGWLDVYLVQGGTFPPPPDAPPGGRLFRNRRDGTFEDVTAAAGLNVIPGGYGHGVTVGDYDNDGDPDLFLTRWGSYLLLRNESGRFVDATGSAGLDGPRDWPTSAAFADLDNDGDLDLYVCHYLRWDAANPRACRNAVTNAYISCSPRDFPALPDHVFRNEGGRFVDVSESAGITAIDTEGRGLGVVAAHLDEDGLIDLYVANDMTANFLWRNRGGFRFEEEAHLAGVAGNAQGGYQAGMGVAAGDLDGDGRVDLAVTNFYGEGTTYYHNLGGNYFADRSAEVGIAVPSRYRLGFGMAMLDANNDGRMDLLTANGHLDDFGDVPYRMALQLFLGQPGGTFRAVGDEAGAALSQPRLGRGLAVGDLDNDGRLDAVVIDQNAPAALLRNVTGASGHWLGLRLEGSASNRDAIGAIVTVEAAGRRQVTQVVGGGSYQSASDSRPHFGLGDAAGVESIEVRWPSGTVTTLGPRAADQTYLVREGAANDEPVP